MTGTADIAVSSSPAQQEEPVEDLVVARSDIEFFDTASGGVCVQVKVRNRGDRPSPPRSLAIYSAPLGVFLRQRHLVTLTVPPLPPGAKTLVQTTAARPRPLPLGRIDRIPPGRLLTALAEDDEAADRSARKGVSPSLRDFLESFSSAWVGNIHVFVHTCAVERHKASGLPVRAGRLNSAIFLVGDRRDDEYAFRLLGDGLAWSASLVAGLASARSLDGIQDVRAIEEGRWIPAPEARFVFLRFYPPADSRRGKIDVEVTQRSTGRKALVEFALEAAAGGRSRS